MRPFHFRLHLRRLHVHHYGQHLAFWKRLPRQQQQETAITCPGASRADNFPRPPRRRHIFIINHRFVAPIVNETRSIATATGRSYSKEPQQCPRLQRGKACISDSPRDFDKFCIKIARSLITETAFGWRVAAMKYLRHYCSASRA